MKRQHRYRVTVEHLASGGEASPRVSESLRFEAASHDEILELARRIRQRGGFDEDSAAALTVGLKLLGEVCLRNRERPMFGEFLPHFGQLIKRLKESAGAGSSSGSSGGQVAASGSLSAARGHAVERLFDA